MRSYESTIAYHPDAGEAGIKDLVERAKQVIASNGGEVSQVVDWGARELAYRIMKQRKGVYVILEFKGTGATVAELERNLRISDRVLRYITVQVDPNRPPLEAPRARREGGPDDLSGEAGSELAGPGGDEDPDLGRDLDAPEAS